MIAKKMVSNLALSVILGSLFFTAIPEADAAEMVNIEGRKITMKVDMWQNVVNVSNKGKANKFEVYLKSGAKFFGDIDTIGKGQIHMKLKSERDGLDDGYDAIINKSEVVAIKIQMREYK